MRLHIGMGIEGRERGRVSMELTAKGEQRDEYK